MELREAGLVTIYNRIKAARETLGIQYFRRTPTAPLDENALPAIFMDEGIDEVTKPSTRSETGYPASRQLEVILEIATEREYNIKQLYRDVRTVVFTGGVRVAESTFIREIRTEGPTGYGLPDVVGMRLVLALIYPDDGT